MKVAVMQPYLLPYIGYWQLLHAVDTFVIFDDVNYINKGYINRNNLLLNGSKHLFTLELQKASQNKKINEIFIGKNQKKLLKTFHQAYVKAPFFVPVFKLLEAIFLQQNQSLAKFVGFSLEKIAEYLHIQTKLIYASSIPLSDPSLKCQNKVIELCASIGATSYLNLPGGQHLYDSKTFKDKGMELFFLSPKLLEYQQFHHRFIPYLSIIDILMFNSQACTKKMLENYELTTEEQIKKTLLLEQT